MWVSGPVCRGSAVGVGVKDAQNVVDTPTLGVPDALPDAPAHVKPRDLHPLEVKVGDMQKNTKEGADVVAATAAAPAAAAPIRNKH